MKAGFVYIVASQRNGTIYVGCTSNLVQRIWQHRTGTIEGFTSEHDCTLLVWYEPHDDLQQARLRERQIKKWNRAWKLKLIEERNPRWEDLFEGLI